MIFLWLLLTTTAFAQSTTDLCEVLDLKNCAGVSRSARRSNAQSLPSTTSASQFNPANVSHTRGLGFEVVYLPGATPTFGFVAGTGKAGMGLVTANQENNFFSARTIELDPDFKKRWKDKEPYYSNKQTLALGAGLFKNKFASWDVGVIGRHNPDTGRLSAGVGTGLRMWIFSAGVSAYRDDQKLKFGSKIESRTELQYKDMYGADEYHERYNVHTYFAGVRLWKLYLDAGLMHTRHQFYQGDATDIRLYSASYIWGQWLLNVAHRYEKSPQTKYRSGKLNHRETINDTYAALQYSIGKHLVLGIHHNYYLLREMAVSGTVFF